MRASYYEGARTFRTGSAPMPTPNGGEALLLVRPVGICGTDLHIYQGRLDHRVPKGGIIGHETFAEVTEAPRAAASRRAHAPLSSLSCPAAPAAPAGWAPAICAMA